MLSVLSNKLNLFYTASLMHTAKFNAAAYADKCVASCFYFNLNQPHSLRECDWQKTFFRRK